MASSHDRHRLNLNWSRSGPNHFTCETHSSISSMDNIVTLSHKADQNSSLTTNEQECQTRTMLHTTNQHSAVHNLDHSSPSHAWECNWLSCKEQPPLRCYSWECCKAFVLENGVELLFHNLTRCMQYGLKRHYVDQSYLSICWMNAVRNLEERVCCTVQVLAVWAWERGFLTAVQDEAQFPFCCNMDASIL